ncbi:hypothetical protein [Mucilaginibacter endophyticus]|uniref:hypothetical protein n=1 Tax=Mucilaginibacter endophyticus TaxID=2675003 RepID=UPI000E0DAFDA|nr:hypothetical protein [Mucilaginibacter endophyticus]
MKKPRYMLWYSFIYGTLAYLLTLLVINGSLTINNYHPKDNPLLVSFCIGIVIKALAKMSFFNITIQNRTFPVGPKLVFIYLDDFLLKRLNDDIDNQLIEHIKRVSKKLSKVGTLTHQDDFFDEAMPTNFSRITRQSYMKEIISLKKSFDKCRHFTSKFGYTRLLLIEKHVDSE